MRSMNSCLVGAYMKAAMSKPVKTAMIRKSVKTRVRKRIEMSWQPQHPRKFPKENLELGIFPESGDDCL